MAVHLYLRDVIFKLIVWRVMSRERADVREEKLQQRRKTRRTTRLLRCHFDLSRFQFAPF